MVPKSTWLIFEIRNTLVFVLSTHLSQQRNKQLNNTFLKVDFNLKYINLSNGCLCRYVKLFWKYIDLE